MATARAQRKWRDKNRYVKTQLNIMARRLVHQDLEEIADGQGLRGKAEAIGFCSFVTKGLLQYAEHDSEAGRLVDLFAAAYQRERDLYK